MINTVDQRCFVLIGFKKISLTVLNSKKQFLYTKEVLIDDLSIEENFNTLDKFLNQNIFEIEKRLKSYIKEIFIIVDYENFFSVDLSFKHNFEGIQFNLDNMTNSLIDIKNQFKKTIVDYEILHMMINKYIVDGITYQFLPNNIDCNYLSLEIRFICLEDNIIKNLKKILSKYEISTSSILCYKYLKNFDSFANRDIFNTADKVLNGLNPNEIFLINKSIKNRGFFEKFFEFFN